MEVRGNLLPSVFTANTYQTVPEIRDASNRGFSTGGRTSEPDDESYPRVFTRRGPVVAQRLFPRRSRFAEPQRAGPLSAQNRILRIFNVPPLSPSLPLSKTQFRETRDFTTAPIPGEFFEIAPLSRLIHPICSTSLCELFLSWIASPKLVNIGHLRKKQVWKQAFSNEHSFFPAT